MREEIGTVTPEESRNEAVGVTAHLVGRNG